MPGTVVRLGVGKTLCESFCHQTDLVPDTQAMVGCARCMSTRRGQRARAKRVYDPEMDAWAVAVIATLRTNPWVNERPHATKAIDDMLNCYRDYRAANGYNTLQIGETL